MIAWLRRLGATSDVERYYARLLLRGGESAPHYREARRDYLERVKRCIRACTFG